MRTSEMQVGVLFVVCALSVAHAALLRVPSLDKAVIQSDRVGGSFAYSSAEGHAYAPLLPPFVAPGIFAPPLAVPGIFAPPFAPLGPHPFIHPLAAPHLVPPPAIGGPLLPPPLFLR